jgi:hypothetical protein
VSHAHFGEFLARQQRERGSRLALGAARLLVVSGEVDDDARYVLVTGRAPTYRIRGWITAGEAKQTRSRIGEG